MGFFKRLFGGGASQPQVTPTPPSSTGSSANPPSARSSCSQQLPSNEVADEFGEVNVIDGPTNREVDLTILMEPSGLDSEGWQTGVALDGSVSMLAAYGHAFIAGSGAPPMTSDFRAELVKKGLMTQSEIDGQRRSMLTNAGIEELRRLGYGESDNEVEPVARDFTAYLAERLDADGGTTVIYWACGSGAEFEVIGDFTAQQCRSARFNGPSRQVGFGKATHLVPAMKYFVERFADAKNGMYVFVTDGRIDDMEAVKSYTARLCKEIAAGTRNTLKFVLIGIGDQVDEDQMTELDDLDSGTDIDLWDHKISKEMRQLAEIFAELVDENQIVAPTGKVIDSNGITVKALSDGVPARIRFAIDPAAEWFELVIGEHRIRQRLPARS
jgi:hypothetical protein